jgi:OPT family oligopeptide transporter
LSILTFDWAQIADVYYPLAEPWWAQANFLMGFVFFFWIITPILYFTNTWYAQYLPILSSHAFDNTGAHYNVTRILAPNNTLDQAKYEAYSPLFLPITFAVVYGLGFAVISATLSHTFLYFRKQILSVMQSRNLPSRRSDIHARLMSKYKEVPQWWYMVIFLGTFVFAIVPILWWPSELPVWALVLALSIAFVHVVPLGMIAAISTYVILLSGM